MMASASDQPLKRLEGRRFSFYPAIRDIEHNEWTLERETWSEALAKNVVSGQELWIPRNHLGEISSSDSPVLIVGLRRELEFKAGAVTPYRKGVVAMPPSPGLKADQRGYEPEPTAPPARTSGAEAQTASLVGKAVLVGVAVCLLAAMFAFSRGENPLLSWFQADHTPADQRYLALVRSDSYSGVVDKLGPPGREQWLSLDDAELQFQALWYPGRRYVVVLMGPGRSQTRYIGTLHDPSREILDAALLSRGGDTASMLRNLPQF